MAMHRANTPLAKARRLGGERKEPGPIAAIVVDEWEAQARARGVPMLEAIEVLRRRERAGQYSE